MPLSTIKYIKDELTIFWKPQECSHSKICWHELKDVFDPTKRPWINKDGASKEAIIAQIKKCPSGALSYELSNETTSMSETENNTVEEGLPILIKAAGPIVIGGKCVITKPDGSIDVKEKTSLCGCGASANKPYCDGSHKQLGLASSSNLV